MTSLKTKESTLQALAQASRHPPSANEIRKQRVSFIMGSLDKESAVTRAKVEKSLDDQEGTKAKP
jgi:hypothetical protein